MEYVDARRLTGPHVLLGEPGTILDINCEEQDRDVIRMAWQRQLQPMLEALSWQDSIVAARPLVGGISLGFTAPIDVLYAATAVNEYALNAARAELAGDDAESFEVALAGIRTAIEEEQNPSLLKLKAAAIQHGVTMLWDDDEVSLGMGKTAKVWPFRELPDIADIDWSAFADIPISIITGTNGKTTTARLVRHIIASSGRTAGLSSTDCIAVGEQVIDHGDWSGPGGARTVLRVAAVEAAVLETARGGLLRRGLGVERADAALITNIAEDHLGDFGSRTIDELLDIKWTVSQAVSESGALVLNADDERLVARAKDYSGRLVWFSMHDDNPVVSTHTANGGAAFVLRDNELQRIDGKGITPVCRATDIPITLDGAARHNIANALAAAALCDQLGFDAEAIRRGLSSMTQAENPGRCNVYRLPQCEVLVDFAHNPHAMQALFDMAQQMPAKRRILAFAQAGDRTDRQIRELATSAWAIGLDHVLISELAAYRRGRVEREVFDLMRGALLAAGARDEQIEHQPEELDSLNAALARAEPGDLVIMLALGDSAGVRARLAELAPDQIKSAKP